MTLLASASDDQREGMQAFFEKRSPRFPGLAPYVPGRPWV